MLTNSKFCYSEVLFILGKRWDTEALAEISLGGVVQRPCKPPQVYVSSSRVIIVHGYEYSFQARKELLYNIFIK